MTQTCAVYARVSTDMQGESLANQVDYAKEYVRRLGDEFHLDEACIYTDFDQSGYYTRFLQRPAVQQALQDARDGRYDVIVMKEISRISRDQAEHIEIVSRFAQCGVRVIAINDNLDSDRPETLDLLGIHSVMSEMESKRISTRVSSGKKSLARRGLWVGEPPIGYRLNPDTRRLEIDPLWADIPRTIFRLFTVEGYGTLKIAAHLNANGLLTKNGNLWSRVTVNRVLRNPAYAGDLVYGRTRNTLKRVFDESGYSKVRGRNGLPADEWVVVRDAHPALVSREVFASAEALLVERAKHNPRRTRHPLTGILRCGRCGSGMLCQTHRSRGTAYRYYVCSRAFRFGRDQCDQPNLRAEDTERVVWQFLLERLQPLCCAVAQVRVVGRATRAQPIRQLEQTLRKAQLGLQRLLVETDLPGDTFEQLKASYVKAIEQAQSQLQTLQASGGTAGSLPADVTVAEWLADVERTSRGHPDEVRRIFRGLLTAVVVDGHEVTEIQSRYRLS
ncbi:MAG: recombinase family protein [Alicyclobacillus sp.]|nr:recombinase family protein [Alicyclobacillus sp.]